MPISESTEHIYIIVSIMKINNRSLACSNPTANKPLYDLAKEVGRGDLTSDVQAMWPEELAAKAKHRSLNAHQLQLLREKTR